MTDKVASTSWIELREMHDFLGETTDAHDAQLAGAINGASMFLEKESGHVYVKRDFTAKITRNEILRSRKRIHPPDIPVASVTSIIDEDDYEIDSDDYRIFGEWIEHDGYWPIPIGWYNLTYNAGHYDTRDDIPENDKLACKMLATILFQRPDSALVSKKVGDLAITYKPIETGGVPSHILGMLTHVRVGV